MSTVGKTHGGSVPSCALPPTSTLFSLLFCCHHDCKNPLQAQQWFFWKAERESMLIGLLMPLYPGVPFPGWGTGEMGRAVSPLTTHTHACTHTRCQELGLPPTSELSMLLISAKCPVYSRHLPQGSDARPMLFARLSRLCLPHALLLYSSHLLI